VSRDRARSPRRHTGLALLASAIVVGAGALLLVEDGATATHAAPPPAGDPGPPPVAAPEGALRPAAGTADHAGGGDGDARLAAGEELAARNAPGAAGASREGLLRAQGELAAALRLGCARPARAQRLLASTWSALAQEWAESVEERREYEERARDALCEVVALAPGDAAARLAYAVAIPERPLRIRELREAVRLAPGDGEIRRVLGVELVEGGDVEEGARQLVEASRLLGRDDLEEHGVAMLRLLHANAREDEEAQVRARLEQLGL
jgi:hypothetical protein